MNFIDKFNLTLEQNRFLARKNIAEVIHSISRLEKVNTRPLAKVPFYCLPVTEFRGVAITYARGLLPSHKPKRSFLTQKTIHQGDDMGRPNRLSLKVDSEQNIFVGGKVIEVGKGEFYLPSM